MADEPADGAPAQSDAAPTQSTPTVEQTAVKPKSIVLFSDGTGNSSAKLFKTNVWRLYEAVDLGLPDPTTTPTGEPEPRVQVALYDNGVGTSNLRPLAILSGIFGFGLKKNVLRLYRYACRNYRPAANGQPADRIYAFGFSRGAFTIRLVAALIATKGIVPYTTDAELNAWSADLFRDFQKTNNPNFLPFVGHSGRWIRNKLIAAKRGIFSRSLGEMPKPHIAEIRFLGVWDTVAAYGGPSAEITRAIDNFIWPLTMTDQVLCEGVRVARHALALDDERDSFHPIPWDELAESQRAEAAREQQRTALAQIDAADDQSARKALLSEAAQHAARKRFYRTRMQQVWFAGMHSDVGGGYPDESLSYVSLLWMMAEAQKAELRLIPDHVKWVNELSNSLGPIHNSRKGLASYYRYQPRKIAAFMYALTDSDTYQQTRIMRDPVLGERQVPPHGYLMSCNIHESVASRVAFGTDGYAPIVLPEKVEIIPYSTGLTRGSSPQVSEQLRDKLRDGDPIWSSHHEAAYDLVWGRRIAYFATAISTLALVAMPTFAHYFMYPRTTDNRWVFERLSGWTKFFPDFIQPWVRAFETSPIVFWILVAVVIVARLCGSMLESKTHSRMKALWEHRLKPASTPLPPDHEFAKTADPSIWQRIRHNRTYQRGGQIFKWYLLPIYVGFAFLGAVAYIPLLLGSQFGLTLNERTICQRNLPPLNESPDDSFELDTKLMCNPTGQWVRSGHHYVLEIAMPVSKDWDWKDDSIDASPLGLRTGQLTIGQYLGIPFRRLADARYMQPLYQVRPANAVDSHQAVLVNRLHPVLYRKNEAGCQIYRADFTPTESGELFLYVNDAVGLIDRDIYYSNNEGKARIHLHDLSQLDPLKPRKIGPDRCKIVPRPPKP